MTTAEKLIAKIPEDIIILKLVEECAELSEVLIKYLTKPEDRKPDIDRITEEMGDVLFRMKVAVEMFGNATQVDTRMKEKEALVDQWVTEKYKLV